MLINKRRGARNGAGEREGLVSRLNYYSHRRRVELRQKPSESKFNSRVNLTAQPRRARLLFRKWCARCRRARSQIGSSIRERHAIWRVTQIKRAITGIKAPTPLAISSLGLPFLLFPCEYTTATFFDRVGYTSRDPGAFGARF